MARIKGSPKTGGRKKGTPDRVDADLKHALTLFINNNQERLQDWLDRMDDDSPKDAFTAFRDMLEYVLPKQARTEMTGKDGGPIQIETTLRTILDEVDGKTAGI